MVAEQIRDGPTTAALLEYRSTHAKPTRRGSGGGARDAGFTRAMFPWQSGSNGREEPQRLRLSPMSGRWLPDRSRLQRHVNVAIAYNVWQHYMIIGSLGFLRFMGAELLIEIARFWSSIAKHPSPFRCVNRPSSCPGARDTFSLTSSRDAHR